jgi:hypothetical protein
VIAALGLGNLLREGNAPFLISPVGLAREQDHAVSVPYLKQVAAAVHFRHGPSTAP